jgi:UDP-N-acetylglucosamine transferase subunit ALG13
MGNVYNRLNNILALSTENPDLPLTNQISLFFGPFLPPSPVSQSLFKPCHLYIHTCTRNILTCLCTSLISKCESLFKDFLDGGKYYEPSCELIEMTKFKSCPPNNITVERLMAKLDSQLKAAPSANVSTIESSVMFRNNQTSSWLDEKDDIKQNSIVTSARKQNAYMINQRKERKQQLLKDHQKIIQERESAKKLKLEKKEKENNKMRENMA